MQMRQGEENEDNKTKYRALYNILDWLGIILCAAPSIGDMNFFF